MPNAGNPNIETPEGKSENTLLTPMILQVNPKPQTLQGNPKIETPKSKPSSVRARDGLSGCSSQRPPKLSALRSTDKPLRPLSFP